MITNSSENTMVLFSTTVNEGKNVSEHSQEVMLLISISAGICSFVTVFGNIIVILSFCINKTLRNFSNYMILSLALSDLTIGAFSMNVFTTYNVHKKWILGPEMCKAWLSVDYTASNASVMNLLVICVDRYLAITKPVKYKRLCTLSLAAVAIFFVWSLSFLIWVPAIMLWEVVSPNATLQPEHCYIPFINDSPTFSVMTIVLAFYFPAMLMCIMYKKVIHQIKHRQRGLRSIIQGANSKVIISKRNRISFLNKFKFKNSPLEVEIVKASSNGCLNTSGAKTKKENIIKKNFINGEKNLILEMSDVSSGSHSSTKSRVVNTEIAINNLTDNLKLETQIINPNHKFRHRSFTMQQKSSPRLQLRSATHCSKFKRSASCSYPFSAEQSNLVVNNTRKGRESFRSNREHRVTVLLKFILLCFIILWLPYSLTVVVAAVCDQCVPATIWNLSYWLCYLNSTVNPFCYGLCNENFRRTFKAIVTTRWWTVESRNSLRNGRRSFRANGHNNVENRNLKGNRRLHSIYKSCQNV